MSTPVESTSVSTGSRAGDLVPLVVALVCVFSAFMLARRIGTLQSWPVTFERGSFAVTSCSSDSSFIWLVRDAPAPREHCNGTLVASGGAATLTLSSGILGSARPAVGEEVEVFYSRSDPARVYLVEDETSEQVRQYVSLIWRATLFIGSVVWLAGWFLGRVTDGNAPASERWYDSLRPRGMLWMMAGVGLALFNWLVISRLVGSFAL